MAEAGAGDPAPPLSPVAQGEAGQRLDLFLAGRLGLTRSRSRQLVLEGRAEVAGRRAERPSRPVHRGEVVSVRSGAAGPPAVTPAELQVVYQDGDLAVVDKPAGMVVHPGVGHLEGTLSQLLQSWGGSWARGSGEERPGIVHRLDRGTSGLLALARSEQAYRQLSSQLRSRTMGREYWALAEGHFEEDRGRIEGAVGRDPKRPTRMAVLAQGREAVTEFQVLERLPRHTALRLRLLTGRTHQIRVHLAYIGRPLADDGAYNPGADPGSARPALHAAMLHLRHPRDGRELEFVSPLPPDLIRLREELGAGPGGPDWPWTG